MKDDNSGRQKRMPGIFSPAIALLNHISYTKKFTLLWLVSLTAIAVVVYSLLVNLERIIQPSQRQLEGLALIKPISRTVQSIQLHRGISAALLGGNEAMRDKRAAQERNAAEVFAALERQLPPNLAAGKEFQNIKANWTQLRKDEPKWTAIESFAAHTRLIEQLRVFEVSVADNYLLTLDTEVASSYLIETALNQLPHTLEHLGQLRAYGIGILAEKRITEDRKIELKIMMSKLDDNLKSLNVNLEKTGHYNPAARDSLRATYQDIVNSAQQITGIVTSDILTGRFSMPPEDFLDTATAAIDRSYVQMHDSLLPMAETLIKARIARAKQELLASVGLSLLVFMLVVYLSISIYYAIVSNIQSLVRALRAFAGGDMHVRAKLHTHDELRQIGESFNKMAEDFSALLAVHKEDEARLRATIETALDAVVQMDAEGIIIGWNNQAEKIFGWTREEAIGRALHETIIPPQFREAHVQGLERFLASGEGPLLNSRIEMSGLHRDDHEFPVELSITAVKTAGKYEFNGFIHDITKRKQTEEELRLRAQMLDSASDTIFVLDLDGNFVYLNEAAWKSRGYTLNEMMGINLHALDTPEYAKIIETRFRELMEKGQCIFESAHRRKDGSVMPVEISSRLIETGGRKLLLSVIRDITERKQAEEKMLHLAHYDALTGLPNRTLFHDRLEQEIKKAHRAGLKMALLFIDLDRFKEVNDTLGHRMGDLMLVETARRIGGCVRETDTVARLGGDEFIIILSELDDASSIERVAENILQKLAEPFQLGNEVAHVSASIGITLYPNDATGIEDLLKDADQAMYAAKNAGRNRLSYFTPALQRTAQTRLRLLNDLRGALAGEQFRVYYQPIVELATGRIHKAEALIRWQHPERGMVSPAEFIPLAEETGLIIEIGNWVFKEAARQVKRWRTLHDAGFQISVNKSPVQFRNGGTTHEVWLDYFQEMELPGQSIAIEITEGLLLDAESSVTNKLLEFRDAGMQVAIDDFGTGYSSLSYLKKFDIDYLKIDQSFVRDLVTDPDDMALSEAIIVMAHKLGLKVIAEGVETEQQRDLLAAAGCDYAQGYLFSRPVPAAEFEVLLKGS